MWQSQPSEIQVKQTESSKKYCRRVSCWHRHGTRLVTQFDTVPEMKLWGTREELWVMSYFKLTKVKPNTATEPLGRVMEANSNAVKVLNSRAKTGPFQQVIFVFFFSRLRYSLWLSQAERLPVPGGNRGGQGSRLLQGLHLSLHRHHGGTQHGCLQGQPFFHIDMCQWLGLLWALGTISFSCDDRLSFVSLRELCERQMQLVYNDTSTPQSSTCSGYISCISDQ